MGVCLVEFPPLVGWELGRLEPDANGGPMEMEVTNQHDQSTAPPGEPHPLFHEPHERKRAADARQTHRRRVADASQTRRETVAVAPRPRPEAFAPSGHHHCRGLQRVRSPHGVRD